MGALSACGRGSGSWCTQLPLGVVTSPDTDTWLALSADALAPGVVHDWAIRPDCGAVVLFTGTVRDHAEGRAGVSLLEYEAYTEQVEPKLAAIAEEARSRWDGLGRIALLHRVGPLELSEVAVVVAVSAPHRGEAFEAARWCIDTVKSTVPIWKKERWEGGEDWGLTATAL
jgi:molybdopterin synthase catalytic subunit